MRYLMSKRFALGFWISLLSCFIQAQQLDYFIKQGMSNSPLLKDYQNQAGLTALDSLFVRAEQKPMVTSTSQILYAPSYDHFGYDEAITNGGNYASTVSASQYLFNGKTLRNKYESIGLQNQSLKNTTKISGNDLIRAITSQYLTALSGYNDLNNGNAYLKLINQQGNLLKQLVSQGIYQQSDFLTLQIEAQAAEINQNRIRTQLLQNVSVLQQLCGIDDTLRFAPEIPRIEPLQPVSPDKSPLFMQFTIDSLRLINERESIGLQYRPRISWYADAGMMSSTPANFYHHFGYSLGLNMSIPVYDGNRRKLEYRKISIRENTRSNYENYFRNQYSRQIGQLHTELESNRKTLEILKSQDSSSLELIHLLSDQLSQGNVSITELINAMKNSLSVKHDISQAQIQEFEIINEINYLLQQ
jgi:outer membrane protein TolC